MIPKVTFKGTDLNTSNQQKNVVAPVMLSSTLLGSIGGYTTFKIKGFDKEAAEYIKETKDIYNKDIQKYADDFEQETYRKALEKPKYSKFLDEVILGQDKDLGKDFKLSDFLDKEDMDAFNKELDSDKQKIKVLADGTILEVKKELSKIKWKHIGIGAGIALGAGIIILAIKSMTNKSKNRDK